MSSAQQPKRKLSAEEFASAAAAKAYDHALAEAQGENGGGVLAILPGENDGHVSPVFDLGVLPPTQRTSSPEPHRGPSQVPNSHAKAARSSPSRDTLANPPASPPQASMQRVLDNAALAHSEPASPAPSSALTVPCVPSGARPFLPNTRPVPLQDGSTPPHVSRDELDPLGTGSTILPPSTAGRDFTPDALAQHFERTQKLMQDYAHSSHQSIVEMRTEVSKEVDHKLSKQAVQFNRELAADRRRITSLERSLAEISEKFEQLNKELTGVKCKAPIRPPEPTTSGGRPWFSDIDHGILRISSMRRSDVSKVEVDKLVSRLGTAVGLDPSLISVKGDDVGSMFIVQFAGEGDYPRRHRDRFKLNLRKDGQRAQFDVPSVISPDLAVRIFFDDDKNPFQKSTEFHSKKLYNMLTEWYPRLQFPTAKPRHLDGLISIKAKRLVWCIPSEPNAPPTIKWNLALAKEHGVDCKWLQDDFLNSIEPGGGGGAAVDDTELASI